MKSIEHKTISKKKFLSILGLGVFASLLGSLFFRKKIVKKSNKVKMLTADGMLVEVDNSKIIANNSSSATSNNQIKKWMKSNT